MKKLLSLLLALILCISSTSLVVYANLPEEPAAITSLEMKVDGKLTMKYKEESTVMTTTMDMKEVVKSETGVDMELVTSTSYGGQTSTSKTYVKDGMLYQEIIGIKIRYRMDTESAKNQISMDTPQFEESYVKSRAVKEVDGGKETTYEIKKEYIEEILKSYSDIGADDMGYGMSINSKDCRLVVLTDNNDMLKSYQIVYGIDYIFDGETMSMEYDYTYTVVSINTITEIAFPDDLDSYIEFSY